MSEIEDLRVERLPEKADKQMPHKSLLKVIILGDTGKLIVQNKLHTRHNTSRHIMSFFCWDYKASIIAALWLEWWSRYVVDMHCCWGNFSVFIHHWIYCLSCYRCDYFWCICRCRKNLHLDPSDERQVWYWAQRDNRRRIRLLLHESRRLPAQTTNLGHCRLGEL